MVAPCVRVDPVLLSCPRVDATRLERGHLGRGQVGDEDGAQEREELVARRRVVVVVVVVGRSAPSVRECS